MTLTSGTRLGPYEIVAPIGAGGMGEVYKARDTRLDRIVALKVIAAAAGVDPALRQRFLREARAISALSHPHICVLYDIGEHQGMDFLVMEYLERETLGDRLGRGPMPIDAALRLGEQVADALRVAHRHGVVHRDLKPGNIGVDELHPVLLHEVAGLHLRQHVEALEDPVGLGNQRLADVETRKALASEQLQSCPPRSPDSPRAAWERLAERRQVQPVLGCQSEFCGKALRGVMHRQHMNLADAHEPVDDAVRRMHDLADQRILEFWHGPTILRERAQPICGRHDARDDDGRVVTGVPTDECADGGQVGASLLGPEDNPHDKNCFLTSSCDTSRPASDWRRPSSIFAMKHSRSIASSIVACSGKP